MPHGPIGLRSPSERDRADIARGLALLNATSPFDIGQAVVVANNQVLVVEGPEGTDRALARVAELRRDRRINTPMGVGVLVKAPKAGQDHRIDLPVIGPPTVEAAAGCRPGRRCRRRRLDARRRTRTHRCRGRSRQGFRHRRQCRWDRPMTVDGAPAFGPSVRRVGDFPGRCRGIRRPARRRADAGAAATLQRTGAVLRRRRPRDGRGRPRQPVADGRLCHHRVFRHSGPAAADCEPHGSGGSRGAGAAAARAGHHRQPGLYVAGCAFRALVRPLDPDHRLRVAIGLGVARGPGALRCERYVDHVLALLPFEPDVHRRLGGPPCSYVGHPLIEEVSKLRPNGAEAQRRTADPPIVLAMPGSRSSEVARLAGDIRRDAGTRCRNVPAPIEVVVPTVPHLLAAGRRRRPQLADQAPHRRRTGRETRGLARRASGSGQIRHHHARTGGCRRADGRGLQGVAARSRGDPPARSGCRPTSSPIW